MRATLMIRNALNTVTTVPQSRIVVGQVPQTLQVNPYASIDETTPAQADEWNTADEEGQARTDTQVISVDAFASDRPTAEAIVEEFKTAIDAVKVEYGDNPLMQWLEYLNDWVTQDPVNRNLFKGTIEYRVHMQRLVNPQ
jgi:hypothetical protein